VFALAPTVPKQNVILVVSSLHVVLQIVLLETAQELIALQQTVPIIKQTQPHVNLHVCRTALALNVLAITVHCLSATLLVDSLIQHAITNMLTVL
jgi:hypothetical protein